jgi:hypothetical protein
MIQRLFIFLLDELKQISTELPEIYAVCHPGKQFLQRTMLHFLEALIHGCNSSTQCLRFAVRISGVDDQAAKTYLQDILSKPFPATDLMQPIYADNAPESNGFWLRGLGENSLRVLFRIS